MLPHEINAQHGETIYRCRNCRASENLRWFGQTSCPVCDRVECAAALNEEYQAAYQALLDEGQEERY